MKNILFIGAALCLSACTSSPDTTQSNVPLDLKTVEAYQAKVYSGNTVPADQRQQTPQVVDQPLNGSDHRPKTTYSSAPPRVILAPSIGYGYHRGYGRYYW